MWVLLTVLILLASIALLVVSQWRRGLGILDAQTHVEDKRRTRIDSTPDPADLWPF